MMYSEFVAGTGCRDNEKNYKVFKDLEIMYMNSDLSKEQIYEYGKKLVDNSKSEEEVALEKKINAEISALKDTMEYHKSEAERNEYLLKDETDEFFVGEWRRCAKYHKDEVKSCRRKIKELKWILA